jgi:hypothetical protein
MKEIFDLNNWSRFDGKCAMHGGMVNPLANLARAFGGYDLYPQT